MRVQSKILFGLAFLMFFLGLAYGVLFDGVAESSASTSTEGAEQSRFGSNAESVRESGASNSGGCLTDPSVLEEIQAQRDGIASARKELAAKEEELKQREQVISEELKKLDLLRDEITKKDNLNKKEAEAKVNKLIETFGTMSPKTAAKVITELDDVLAVAVIAKMDTDKLAKIMAQLDPKRASRLNELFAGVARVKPVSVAANISSQAAEAKATSLKQEGGEKNDGKNISSTNDPNGRAAGNQGPARKPGSAGAADVAGGKTPGSNPGGTKVQ